MQKKRYQTEDLNGGAGSDDMSEADDYLSQLARSVLSRGNNQFKPTAPAPSLEVLRQRRSGSRAAVARTETLETRATVERSPTTASRDWVREVAFYDESGNLIPGTILVLEDGNVAVFKERKQSRDYDIVYLLRADGTAEAKGVPLFSYEIEPIGRLSSGCLQTLATENRWDRDMMVFHLLKFKDRRFIPTIQERASTDLAPREETFTQWAVKKLNEQDVIEVPGSDEDLDDVTEAPAASQTPEPQPEPEEKKLARGRKFTVAFGPNQKWEAVYWGKDELGHVVAHHTHEKWSLMHLDLDRFKDSIEFHGMADVDLIRQMENDFATQY